jgi:hypothetical protein
MTPPGRPVSNNATEQGTTSGDPVDSKRKGLRILFV